MSSAKTAQRRISSTRIGVGSLVCLASSVGAHAAAAEESAAEEVKEVVVTGHVSTIATTLQDTPQNVTVVPQQVLTDQAVNNVQDALKNVPGITLNAGEGGTHGDNINLRGFAASDDFFLDGLRDTGFYTRDSFNLDSLEVYKGPASTLFGRGSTGGVVNQVSKTPQLEDFVRGSVTGGTNSELRGTADVNYAFGDSSVRRLLRRIESRISDEGQSHPSSLVFCGAVDLVKHDQASCAAERCLRSWVSP